MPERAPTRDLSNWGRRGAIILHDLAMTAVALVAAFLLRFEPAVFATYVDNLPRTVAGVVALAGLIYWFAGLYEAKWRFASIPDLLTILRATAILALLLLAVDYAIRSPRLLGEPYFGISVILIFSMLLVALISGPRIAYRGFKDRARTSKAARRAESALLLGNGRDADAVLRAIESGTFRNLKVAAILSPRVADLGQRIRGVRVIESPDKLDDTLTELARVGKLPDVVLFCPSVIGDPDATSALFTAARAHNVRALQMRTDLAALGEDEPSAGALRPFRIEDLLLRPAVATEEARLRAFVKGRSFAITGGGGSIGAEIARRLAANGATRVLILENSEPSLYAISEELAERHPGLEVVPLVCDVRDVARLRGVLREYTPNVVFHAAALKHVHLLEANWTEGVKTNVIGTANVVDASVEAGVEAMVLISTDKAVKPVSVLGATKRLAELIVRARDQELARRGAVRTRLVAVRFGNVLGSVGSVVPKFLRQIEEGGPVTVTHPDVVRFFMTIPEACDLVLTAAGHAVADAERKAALYILNMGHAIRIKDLAEKLIRINGREPGRDIAITYTGLRPGERLTEHVLEADEPTIDIGLAGIIAAEQTNVDGADLARATAALAQAAASHDAGGADKTFRALFATYGASDAKAE
jgi:O-antigen biosynthesis protein WbqV